jgi:hypothetical protein
MKNKLGDGNFEYGKSDSVFPRASDDDSRLSAFHWEQLGVFGVLGIAFFFLIVFVGYKYLHSSFLITPPALR